MRSLTLVLPFFCNKGMLAEHHAIWNSFPADLRQHLHVVVVDDCSPEDARLRAEHYQRVDSGSLQLFRCLEKRRWNWLFARNLGVSVAPTDWVLLTDMDHALPERTLGKLLTIPLDVDTVYRLGRVDAPHPWPYALADCHERTKNGQNHMHPNTWMLTRAMYDRVGGYDERLSGCYGTDGEFKDRIHQTAKAICTLPSHVLVRYSREVLPDASTTIYTRKGDPTNDDDLVRRRQARALIPDWRPLRLTFPYEQVL